jgi:translation elongation factor EF-G
MRPKARQERIGRIVRMHANDREEVDEVFTPATSPRSSA